jgi:hypothetical protein
MHSESIILAAGPDQMKADISLSSTKGMGGGNIFEQEVQWSNENEGNISYR